MIEPYTAVGLIPSFWGIRRREDIVGVVTLEFPQGTPIDPQTEASLGVGAELLAPEDDVARLHQRLSW